MCSHLWVDVNDVRVCRRCGLTIRKADGKFVMFDREFINASSKKRRAKK